MTQVKKGDKVKFLNYQGGGIISKIENNIAFVTDENGFDIPMLVSEIIKDDQVNSDNSKADKILINKNDNNNKIDFENEGIHEDEDKDEIIEGNDLPDTWFALLPVYHNKTIIKQAEIYLINNSNFKLLYCISEIKDKTGYYIDAGTLKPNTKIKITDIYLENINETKFSIQIILYKPYKYIIQEPINKCIIINQSIFYDFTSFVKTEFFKEKVIIYKIENIDEKKLNPKNIKNLIYEKKDIKSSHVETKTNIDTDEIDLHIESIYPNYKELDNQQILEMQMDKFKLTLDLAIQNNQKRIIYIHGVGNGKLKHEIRKYIDTNCPKLKYQDASFKEYGYGATMIILR